MDVLMNVRSKRSTTYELMTLKICLNCHDEIKMIDDQVKRYFDVETLGINNFTKYLSEDKRAIDILDKTSKYFYGS